jgi:3-polyprenyl-4-hydroxybenzoate decarboxylase
MSEGLPSVGAAGLAGASKVTAGAGFSGAGAAGLASKAVGVTEGAIASAAGASVGVTTSAAAFLVAAFLAGLASAAGAGTASRNLRAAGASIVDDADFTNSPSSWSLATASLLVIPSSLASS